MLGPGPSVSRFLLPLVCPGAGTRKRPPPSGPPGGGQLRGPRRRKTLARWTRVGLRRNEYPRLSAKAGDIRRGQATWLTVLPGKDGTQLRDSAGLAPASLFSSAEGRNPHHLLFDCKRPR